MGGPTTDYAIDPIRERADGATSTGRHDGDLHVHERDPRDARGTWGFSIEARRTVDAQSGAPTERRLSGRAAFNPVDYVAVTGAVAAPRRDGRRHREVQRVPRPAGAPRRPAAQHPGVRHLPQPERQRRRAAAGRPPGRVDRLQAHDPPDPHRRGADAGLHGLRLRRHPTQLQRGPLPRRPAGLPATCHIERHAEQVAREPAAGPARDRDAERLVSRRWATTRRRVSAVTTRRQPRPTPTP